MRFPFSDLSKSKVRPGVVVSVARSSQDIFVIPLTSQTANLLEDEFVLSDWGGAGLNVPTAVKRGIFSIHQRLILKSNDSAELNNSLRYWMELI